MSQKNGFTEIGLEVENGRFWYALFYLKQWARKFCGLPYYSPDGVDVFSLAKPKGAFAKVAFYAARLLPPVNMSGHQSKELEITHEDLEGLTPEERDALASN